MGFNESDMMHMYLNSNPDGNTGVKRNESTFNNEIKPALE